MGKNNKNEDDLKDLELYRQYLEKLSGERSGDMFSCGGLDHTSILMSIFFEKAREARIYCCSLESNLDISGPYWAGLTDYVLYPEKKLYLLIDKNIDYEQLEKIKEISGNPKNLQIRLISDEGKNMMIKRFGEDLCNFAVFDGGKFRFEYDPPTYKSFGSFNRPEQSTVLSDLFDSVFKISEPL